MQSINFKILKPEELLTLATRTLLFIKPLVPADPFLTEFCPRLEKGTSDLSQALVMTRGSVFTPQIYERDSYRDRRFLGLKNYVLAFTYHPDEKLATAAEELLALIEARGPALYNYGYTEETAQLSGLLDDLQTPKAQAAIALIQTDFWVTVLSQAQRNFETLYQQKVETEATQALPRIRTSRDELTRNISRLFVYIETNLELNPEKYKSVTEQIDEVMVDVMTIARTRKTKQNETKAKPAQ